MKKKSILIIIGVCLAIPQVNAERVSFKLKDIPKDLIKPCLDETGRIADVGENWNHSDVGLGANTPPRARLVKACVDKDQIWKIVCEKGGYGTSYLLVKMKPAKEKGSPKPEITSMRYPPDITCD